jgi:hypothetical protein
MQDFINNLEELINNARAKVIGQYESTYGANVTNLMTSSGENQANALLAAQRQNASSYGDIAKLYGQTNPNFSNLFGGGSTSGNGYYST